MRSIAQSLKQMNDRLDRIDSIHAQTLQSVQKAIIQITEKVDRQEAMVCSLQTKVFGPERGLVVERYAGLS